MIDRWLVRTSLFASAVLIATCAVGCDQQSADTTGVQASAGSGGAVADSDYSPADEAAEEAARQQRSNRTTTQPTDSSVDSPNLPTPVGPPPVAFEPSVIDFGLLKPGQSADSVLRIRNNGGTPLTVLSTKVSCTCTTLDLQDTVIQPGEAVEMEVRYKGKIVLGPSTARVRVLFEDYEDHLFEVDVKAEIALAIRAEPAFIKATDAEYGQFKVASQDGMPFRVLTVNGGEPDFVAFDPATDQPRNTYFLKWDVRQFDPNTCADADGNPMPAWVPIETDHPECPILDVYLRHRCTIGRPPVAPRTWLLADRRILMGGIPAGEPYEFSINMKWLRGGLPDDIARSVSAQSDVLTAELIEANPKEDVVQLKIRVTPNANHRGLIYDSIWIHGSKGSAQLLMVGTVQDPTA